VTEAIVEAALLLVGQNGVGLGRFLEAFLGVAVVRVAIRMMLQRQLAIGALDLLIGGRALDPEDVVVVAFAHVSAHVP
jgi:hypothetical protein